MNVESFPYVFVDNVVSIVFHGRNNDVILYNLRHSGDENGRRNIDLQKRSRCFSIRL